ncbi:hypothetical protein ElyMa_005477700 [Elysia marginata]|uniref:PDZ domain-containing protein n=1 Tax=Elysia marginata TaxID=1093978 RepID=A0AAV4EQW5_9GAST|nr:hypothetical protein ElyMa_005477700 [Elysia marginata]
MPVKIGIGLSINSIKDAVEKNDIGVDIDVIDKISSNDLDSMMQLQPLLTSSTVVIKIQTKSTVSTRTDASTTPTKTSETANETCLTTLPTKAAAVEEETPTKSTRTSEEAGHL